jgi:hypothetical protein
MKTMHKILRAGFTAIFVILMLSAGVSWGDMKADTPAGESKVVQGVKATLIVTPGKNMFDLYLYDLPKKIFDEAQERYIDNNTGYAIAVLKVSLYEKERDVMVAYIHEGEDVKLLTIHPLKEGQKENRIKTGRWRKIQ